MVPPTSPLQCEALLKIDDKRSLCLYTAMELTNYAKIYENGVLRDAPDGAYYFVNHDVSPKRIYKGIVYSFDEEQQPEIVKPKAGWLSIYVGHFNNQLIFFCPKGGSPDDCSLANGKYLSKHQLEIPIKNGEVDLNDNNPDPQQTYCLYVQRVKGDLSSEVTKSKKEPSPLERYSPDKTEFVSCSEGD